VIQLHLGKLGCIEGNRLLLPRDVEELLWGYEQKLSLRINEASNERRASDPIHLDVAARSPFDSRAVSSFPQYPRRG
jgi:hypothetical protein